KGHDLPHLTLVAIAGVDEGLLSLDFRASERLAQQLVQVAGRAGRAAKPGRVLLQTHHPGHPLLRQLLAQGYAAAAQSLLAERRQSLLPPEHGLQVAGPMPAPMPLRAGRQRGQLLLEATNRRDLHAALRPWAAQLGRLPAARKVRWSLDVDPIDLY